MQLRYVFADVGTIQDERQFIKNIERLLQVNDGSLDHIKVMERIFFKEEYANTSLLITDSDNHIFSQKLITLGSAVLGYGREYHGTAAFVLEEIEGMTGNFAEMVFCRFHGIPVKILETERLVVREITTGDLPELMRIYENPEITRFVEPLYEYAEELTFTQAYIKNMYGFYGYGLWMVFEKASGQMVGRIGLDNREIDGKLEVELGYLIAKEQQRKGYAYECCQHVLKYAFEELELDKVWLCTEPENLASVALAEKLQFEKYAENISGYDVYKRSKE